MAVQRWFSGQALPADITDKGLPGDVMDLEVPRQVGPFSECLVTDAWACPCFIWYSKK